MLKGALSEAEREKQQEMREVEAEMDAGATLLMGESRAIATILRRELMLADSEVERGARGCAEPTSASSRGALVGASEAAS